MKQISRAGKILIVIGVLFFLTISTLSVLPVVISSQMKSWIEQNGGEQVSIENVDFDPFSLELVLNEVEIFYLQQQTFHLPVLKLKAQFLPLFDNKLVIESLSVRGMDLSAALQEKARSHVAGLLYEKLFSQSEQTRDQDKGAAWSLKVNELQMEDVRFEIDKDNIRTSLMIHQISLSDIDTENRLEPAWINLDAQLNQSEVKVSGELLLFDEYPGFDGRIKLSPIKLNTYLKALLPEIPVNELTIGINGKVDFTQQNANSFLVKYQGELLTEGVNSSLQNINLKLNRLSWQGKTELQLNTDSISNVSVSGQFLIDDVNLEETDRLVSLQNERINWQGNVLSQFSQAEGQQISLDGKMIIDQLMVHDRQQKIQLSNERLSWAGNNVFHINNSQQFTLTGELVNRGLQLQSDQHQTSLKNDQFSWQGHVKSAMTGQDRQITLEGKVNNEGLQVTHAAKSAVFTNQSLSWSGRLSLDTVAKGLQLTSVADLALQDTSLVAQPLESEASKTIFSASAIEASHLQLESSNEISTDQLQLSALKIGQLPSKAETDRFLLTSRNINLERFQYDAESGVVIDRLLNDGLNIQVFRDADGLWSFNHFVDEVIKLLGDGTDTGTEATSKTGDNTSSPEDAGLALKIGEFQLLPGSQVRFEDHTFHKPLAQQIIFEAFSLQNLDTAKQMASPLMVKARVDNAQINIDGSVAMFANTPEVDLKAKIKALSLLPYSFFVEKNLGHQVDSGLLNADSNIAVKDGELSSSTQLSLFQLDIKPLSEKQLEQINGKLSSSLQTGLGMLKDKNDTIQLDLPINGPLKNLEVDTSNVINKAMGSALKTGAKTYFAAALFPFGTLLVIADAAADKAMQVTLDPVVFQTGEAVLSDKHRQYLEKVAKVLDEKPDIYIKVCGVSVNKDRMMIYDTLQAKKQKIQAKENSQKTSPQGKEKSLQIPQTAKPVVVDDTELMQKMNELSLRRADLVKQYLIKDKSVSSDRLVDCQPRIETEKETGSPRADLLL